jgi:hypothetical protein
VDTRRNVVSARPVLGAARSVGRRLRGSHFDVRDFRFSVLAACCPSPIMQELPTTDLPTLLVVVSLNPRQRNCSGFSTRQRGFTPHLQCD